MVPISSNNRFVWLFNDTSCLSSEMLEKSISKNIRYSNSCTNFLAHAWILNINQIFTEDREMKFQSTRAFCDLFRFETMKHTRLT